jgi:hypothetical protein
MPGFDPASAIAGGVSGVFNYLGAKKQANAIEDASKLQAEGTQRALDFTKQQYADVTGRLKPYVDAGSTASSAASRLLQSSPYAAAIRPQPSITLRAPDGSTKQFVAGDPMIARAQQAGAVVVTGGGAPPVAAGSGYSPAALAARGAA